MRRQSKLELDILSFFSYLISPFLSLPLIILGLYKQTKCSAFLYSLLVGFISFLYKPTSEMDKARHIDSYEFSKNISLESFFIRNFEGTPDFLFHLILYAGSNYNINVHIIFFIISFITIYLVFKVYIGVLNNHEEYSPYMYIILPLFIFSISYIDVIVGIRFTLASSLVFYGYYLGLIEKRKYSFVWILLGAITHFGVILFFIIYLLYPLLKKINGFKLKILLILSLLFFFMSKDLILVIFKAFGFGGAFESKIDSYIDTDNLGNGTEGFAQKFIDFFNVIWVYIISFFLIFKNKSRSECSNVLIWLLIFTNVFVSFPIVYNRYALFTKLILVLFLLNDELRMGKTKISKVFVLIFVIICFNQLVVMREGLVEIFRLDINGWSFIKGILDNNYTSNDIK